MDGWMDGWIDRYSSESYGMPINQPSTGWDCACAEAGCCLAAFFAATWHSR